MKKLLNKKNILTFLILVGCIVAFYFAYGVMSQKINDTYFYVVFDTNGGSRIAPAKVRINEVLEMPENPTKKGYTFKYWKLDNQEYDFKTKVRNNITLVAIWEAGEEPANEEDSESQGSEE